MRKVKNIRKMITKVMKVMKSLAIECQWRGKIEQVSLERWKEYGIDPKYILRFNEHFLNF